MLRITAVEDEPDLARQRLDVEPLPEPVADPPVPRPATWFVPYAMTPVTSFAQAQISTVSFTQSSITTTVAGQVWHESELQAMIGLQGWNAVDLVQAIVAAPPPAPPTAPEAGAFSFGARLGFFGHNAPRWGVLPSATSSTHSDPYPDGWDDGDTGVPANGTRTVWQDLQGNAVAPFAYVERAVPDVVRTSWVVFDAPDVAAQAYSVLDARETSRADFGLSGRAMRLRLADLAGVAVTGSEPFGFRTASAHVASRRLPLAELPIETPVGAGDTAIELDGMVLGLVAGQPLALVGDDATVNGVAAAEIAVVDDIVHADGRSTLLLQDPLTRSYRRDTLTINANVVHATHGESVDEVLGNGDAAVAHQRFVLKRPPLTFFVRHRRRRQHAGAARGRRACGEACRRCTAAGRRKPSTRRGWPTTGRCHAHLRRRRCSGARLPSGTVNVTAHYRSGIGPDGEVDCRHADDAARRAARACAASPTRSPASGAEGPSSSPTRGATRR